MSATYDVRENIVTLFYHDLVVHFTGIILHRDAMKSYKGDVMFPWVNKRYALQPFIYSDSQFRVANRGKSLATILKGKGLLPVSAGHAIPLGYGQQIYLDKILKIILRHDEGVKGYLPNRSLQIEYLESVVRGLCEVCDMVSHQKIWANWKQHVINHTTDKQPIIRDRGILLGTRNDLHNRKLALNFMQQSKEVVGFTHGEISNNVYDEPVYGYSDKTLCTTLVDYGTFRPKLSKFPAIILPKKVIGRSSGVIKNRFKKSDCIASRELGISRALLIPTIYQDNFLYGPKHAIESYKYYQWHRAIVRVVPNITVKMHPKTRASPKFDCKVDWRRLEDCIEEYDVLIFDYIATAAVLAIYTDKPVIYFDIGLRTVASEFSQDLEKRCMVIKVDLSGDIDEQIRAGLVQYQTGNLDWSNLQLEKYALCTSEQFGIARVILDILRPAL